MHWNTGHMSWNSWGLDRNSFSRSPAQTESCLTEVVWLRVMPSCATSQFTRGLLSESTMLLLTWVTLLVLRAGKAFMSASEGNFKECCVWLVMYFSTGKTETMERTPKHNFFQLLGKLPFPSLLWPLDWCILSYTKRFLQMVSKNYFRTLLFT